MRIFPEYDILVGMNLFPAITPFLVTIPPIFLWLIFAIILFFFIVMSLIFSYHWNRYGGHNTIIVVGGMIYFLGGIIMIGIALFALLSLS